MTEVSLVDPQLGPSAEDGVLAVFDDGQLADGPVVRSFEDRFAEYVGVDHAVATTNGTAALHAALHALGVGEGDAVVTTPFSFVASANAVRFCGATPVFADVDPETYTLDPRAVETKLEARDDVAAILAVHLYGLPADVEALGELADRHDVALVEDAAQAHGAAYEGDRVGTFGDAAAFSFYPTKNMTTGEGGMVVTDRDRVAERTARFVDHGREVVDEASQYRHAELGHNFRMSSIAAAIGLAQLDRLPSLNERRRANAARLTDGLADVPGLTTPTVPDGYRHVYNQYTVRYVGRPNREGRARFGAAGGGADRERSGSPGGGADRERFGAPAGDERRTGGEGRDGLRDFLAERGIDTGVYYPRPIHEQPAYENATPLVPAAEEAAREVLSLPVHPQLSAEQLDHVVESVREYDGLD